VGHEVQQLGYFSLKGQGLLGHGVNVVFLDSKFGNFSFEKQPPSLARLAAG
jgi:hypothetical protein